MIACDATIAAKMAMISDGIRVPCGTELKKGFEYASGKTLIYAACPVYASIRQG